MKTSNKTSSKSRQSPKSIRTEKTKAPAPAQKQKVQAMAARRGKPAAQAAKPAKSGSKLSGLASLIGLGPKKAPENKSKAPMGPARHDKKVGTSGAKKPAHGKTAPAKAAAHTKAPAAHAAPKAAAHAPAPAKKAAAPAAAHAAPKAAAPAKKGGSKKQPLSGAAAALAAATANIRASKAGTSRNADPSSDQVCREVACDGLSTTAGYCRLHYIKNWKKIKRKELILKEGKLNQYIEELVVKYPDKYIEAIRQDLASDKDFAKVIYDLDLDEGVDEFDAEGESLDSVVDTIKRDFDDEGDTGF